MFVNNQKKDNNKFNNISSNHNGGKELFLKDTKLFFNSKINNEYLNLYSQNHVLDINSNEKLYMYNKNKDIYCHRCFQPALFSKINGFFIKCLNCHNRICKYCLKEFNDEHMDIMSENHCKVYYRKDDFYWDNSLAKYKFFLQLFFVFAMYYLMFAGLFYIILGFLKNVIKISSHNRCSFLIINFFLYFLSFIFVLICSPFLIIIYPFFPTIISIIDY